ncbi:MAG: phage integrase SAM-like domain-containing protein [Paludibacter sp.]
MKATHNILFFFDKVKNSTEGLLRVRIVWNKNKVSFSLGYRVDLTKWSTEAQRCINGTSHGKKKIAASEINNEIQRVYNFIDELFNKHTLQGTTPTADELNNEYNRTINAVVDLPALTAKTIFDYFDEFVASQSVENNWKLSTLEKFSAIKNHFIAFDKNLTFDRFTNDGLNDYLAYLRDKKEMRNSTIKKQLSFLKWFLKWATKKKYNTALDYQTFSPKMTTGTKKVIFLDWTELMKVYKFDFSTATKTLTDGTIIDLEDENKKALERVRDVFCFCCFTSLRYSDVENLKRTDIKKDTINITTIKTDDTITIDLNNYSSAILAKYANEVYPNNKALPVISNVRMNDHLKDMGEVCGLNESITITYYKGAKRFDEVYKKYNLLTTHCGRRTFICNALTLGIAPTTVMEWTGHSDYKSMKPYIDASGEAKKKAMELFNR